ncbi:MAG: ATP-dependent DNA ligase [Limisphaerales bacterium]
MHLPVSIPFPPMEATLVTEIPSGKEWQYEPKWDGFRCLAFRDGEEVQLQSKSGQDLTRYFPEVVEVFQQLPSTRFVLDGELVVPVGDQLSFDDLLQRIHPAASRVQKLSKTHPAHFIAFDLLVDAGGKPLWEQPLEPRRKQLELFAKTNFKPRNRLHLCKVTRDIQTAQRWFADVGAHLDGIIAKRVDLPYQSGNRHGMQKVKKIRTADCVVGGFRYGTGKKEVGSLLLGLYDGEGLLHHVGFTSGLKSAEKAKLTRKLEGLVQAPGFSGRAPGGPSRWSTERSTEWQPLKPELVVEVAYDHISGERFRHGTRLLRWRPDKAPEQCTFDQLKAPRSAALAFASSG